MDCPNFTFGTQPRYHGRWGYLVGYNYLGNANSTSWSKTSRFYWNSPQKVTDSPTNAILADANHWGDVLTMAPHCEAGLYQVNSADGHSTFTRIRSSPLGVNVVGGNIGLLDGSVHLAQRRSD